LLYHIRIDARASIRQRGDTKSPLIAACARFEGINETGATRIVSSPSPPIASRAFTIMLMIAVSNWLGSALVQEGGGCTLRQSALEGAVRIITADRAVA